MVDVVPSVFSVRRIPPSRSVTQATRAAASLLGRPTPSRLHFVSLILRLPPSITAKTTPLSPSDPFLSTPRSRFPSRLSDLTLFLDLSPSISFSFSRLPPVRLCSSSCSASARQRRLHSHLFLGVDVPSRHSPTVFLTFFSFTIPSRLISPPDSLLPPRDRRPHLSPTAAAASISAQPSPPSVVRRPTPVLPQSLSLSRPNCTSKKKPLSISLLILYVVRCFLRPLAGTATVSIDCQSPSVSLS